MRFGTFGPFDIPRDEYGNVSDSLSDFWEAVDSEWEALSNGRGCYVFGISPSGGSRVEPWYVGKTNRQGFDCECFTPHKLNHYSRALNRYDRGKPRLFWWLNSGRTASVCIEETRDPRSTFWKLI